jgi:hypothetical protein
MYSCCHLALSFESLSGPRIMCRWPVARHEMPGTPWSESHVCTTRLATVVVHVHHPGLGRDRLRDLMGVARRGDAGADVQELPYPGLGGEVADDPAEKRPVCPCSEAKYRRHLEHRVDGGPVGRVVVLAARVLPLSAQDREQASWKTC